jgi:hypothetical protein
MVIDGEYLHRKLQILKRYRDKAELGLFSFDVYELFSECQNVFPELEDFKIEFWIIRQPSLACIAVSDESASIIIHPVLNHTQTPIEIMRYIIIHELIHIIIRPREIDGKIIKHSPEFLEKEKELVPERHICWYWVYDTLFDCLKIDNENERTFVKRNWRKMMRGGRPTYEEVRENSFLLNDQDLNKYKIFI